MYPAQMIAPEASLLDHNSGMSRVAQMPEALPLKAHTPLF